MAPQQRPADATSPDGSADHGAALIAHNRRLLAWAAETQGASQAAMLRAEATLVNVMETRIRLAHDRLRALNGLPAELLT
jgi:hypothetical protein